MTKGLSGHESANAETTTWLTPPSLLNKLGDFDLDPCTPLIMPWKTAAKRYTIEDDGLKSEWFGRVWLNPPYGKELLEWMHKMGMHNNGIALTYARTETKAFQHHIFPVATSMLFIQGRIAFCTPDGKPKSGGGAPSVLISYGEDNADILAECGIQGHHLLINAVPVITITKSPDWRSVVSISLINLNKEASLKQIYQMAARIAPDKVLNNKHFEAKIRQKLQKYFKPVDRGVWTLFEN